jgi:hypothetical protein
MTSKTFVSSFPVGSAQYVIAHAAWQRSRGRSPSEPFLTERNPRKALKTALSFHGTHTRQTTLDALCGTVGSVISRRKSYREMDKQELKIAIRGIVASSSSREEILRRLQDEIGCPEENVMLDVSDVPTDRTGIEARELVRALSGLVTKHGAMVMIEIMPGMDELEELLLEDLDEAHRGTSGDIYASP